MNIAEIAVPRWYIDARKNGDSEKDIASKVREFCLEALARKAKRTNTAAPTSVDDELVRTTIDMYEHALASAGEK